MERTPLAQRLALCELHGGGNAGRGERTVRNDDGDDHDHDDDMRRSREAYVRRWVEEGRAHAAVLYAGRRIVHATLPTPAEGGVVMTDKSRVLEKDGYRIQVECCDGEWCASIAYKREDGVHRPMMAATALDDVGALRELCRQVDRMRGAVVVAGKLAVKLRG